MKKHFWIAGYMLAVLIFQNPDCLSAQPMYGFRAGASVNTFANNPFNLFPGGTFNSRTTFTTSPDIAFFINIPLGTAWSVQPEFHFLEKGGLRKESFYFRPAGSNVDERTTAKTRYLVSYLEAPLVVKYRAFNGRIGLSFLAGGSVGRAISQRFKGEQVFYFNERETHIYAGNGEKIAWDNEFGSDGRKDNRTDLSALAGIELSKTVGKLPLILDLRTSHDFTSWRTFENDPDRKEVLHRNIQATIGVMF